MFHNGFQLSPIFFAYDNATHCGILQTLRDSEKRAQYDRVTTFSFPMPLSFVLLTLPLVVCDSAVECVFLVSIFYCLVPYSSQC